MLEFFSEPLALPYMQRALILSIMVSLVSALFSCFLILKGWALMGDALSHAVLPGVALAYLLGLPLLLGAFITALFCSLTIDFIKNRSRVKEDVVMGILFSALFALGLVMVVSIESELHLLHILFGNVLGQAWAEVIRTSVLAAVVAGVLLFKKGELLLYCFDPTQLRISGLSIQKTGYLLQILLTSTIVVSLYTTGILLIISMLITPGATARLIHHRFSLMLFTASVVAILSCLLGVLFSYHWDIATAPLIILFQSFFFLLAFFSYQIKPVISRPPLSSVL